jgi:hypothetical protein
MLPNITDYPEAVSDNHEAFSFRSPSWIAKLGSINQGRGVAK